MKRTNLSLVLVLLLALVASGCAKQAAQQQPETTPSQEAPPVVSTMPSQEVTGFRDQSVSESAAATTTFGSEQTIPQLQRIFFEYDQFTLSDQARSILTGNAAYLRANPSQRIVIEGHTDERGSDEYNLALGERRARAALNYLVSLGIGAERLSILSYGEERPMVSGSDESAWSQNRRAEFKGIR
jgi:peptidoglycan-associated lipoprotein